MHVDESEYWFFLQCGAILHGNIQNEQFFYSV